MASWMRAAEELAMTRQTYEEDSQMAFDQIYKKMQWAAVGMPNPSSQTPQGRDPSTEVALKVLLPLEELSQYSQQLEERLEIDAESQALEIPLIVSYERENAAAEESANEEQQQKENPMVGKQARETKVSRKLPHGCTVRDNIVYNSKGKPFFPPGWTFRNYIIYDSEGNPVRPKMSRSSDETTQSNPSDMYDDDGNWRQEWTSGQGEQWTQGSVNDHSTITSVPTHTLREDDTGHIDLMKDFVAGVNTDPYSQDQASYDAEEAETQTELPETPALPKPFQRSFHESEVLAPSQLFATTQISPMNQAPTSAARPSPADVYSADNIVSPEKKALHSSPSLRVSFNHRKALPRQPEPLLYVSKKEEQERMDAENAIVVDSLNESQSTDGFGQNSQESRRQQRKDREHDIDETLARVSAPARTTSWSKNRAKKPVPRIATSKAPVPTDEGEETESDETEDDEDIPARSADIAVPGSTESPGVRRRRLAEEYIAQTNGTDARDTQNSEVIVDSQGLPSTRSGPSSSAQAGLPDLIHESLSRRSQSPIKPTPNQDPLSEVSANAPKTPKSGKGNLELEMTPTENPLRAFAELDGSSPVVDSQISLTGIGFSQNPEDVEFQQIVYESSFPAPKSSRTPAVPASSRANMSDEDTDARGTASSLTPTLAEPTASLPSVPVTEIDGTPGGAAVATRINTTTGSSAPVVLDTPQASHPPRPASSEISANDTAADSPVAAAESALETLNVDPVTPVNRVVSKASQKRKKESEEVSRPAKKLITYSAKRTNALAFSEPASVEQDTVVQSPAAETGLEFSAAPEGPASSATHYFSVQSSALSETSSIATPKAFKDLGKGSEAADEIPDDAAADIADVAIDAASDVVDVAAADPESGHEAGAVGAKGRPNPLKRKRATDTPTSSLATETSKPNDKPRPVIKAKKPTVRVKAAPKSMATPKAVKALREQSSGFRSSARQAAGSASGSSRKTTPQASRSRGGSISSASRSSSRLSRAPSEAVSRPSTPVGGRATAKKSTKGSTTIGIFRNMAFAVSYVEKLTDKEIVLDLIDGEDGQIIEQGFDELFTVDTLPVTPSSRRASLSAPKDSCKVLETIKPNENGQQITFACVIADQPSRRAKFMEGLALDLPCLHGEWILQCVSKQRIIDWTPYLLSSGPCRLLQGSHHSRSLSYYPAESANFSKHFESEERMRLFRGKKVMVVVGTTKSMVDKKKAYVFIAHALGAEKVGTVPNIEAARRIFDTEAGRQKWDWVYVDRDEKLGQAALVEAPRRGSGAKGKKATKTKGRSAAPKKATKNGNGVDGGGEDDPHTSDDENMPQVIGDEFVVESLILGRLFHDHTAENMRRLFRMRADGEKYVYEGKVTEAKPAAAAEDEGDTTEADELS